MVLRSNGIWGGSEGCELGARGADRRCALPVFLAVGFHHNACTHDNCKHNGPVYYVVAPPAAPVQRGAMALLLWCDWSHGDDGEAM